MEKKRKYKRGGEEAEREVRRSIKKRSMNKEIRQRSRWTINREMKMIITKKAVEGK